MALMQDGKYSTESTEPPGAAQTHAGKREESEKGRGDVQSGQGPTNGVAPRGGARGEQGHRGHEAPEAAGPARKCEAKYSTNSFMPFPGLSEPIWGEKVRVTLEMGLALKVLRQSAAGVRGQNRFATG